MSRLPRHLTRRGLVPIGVSSLVLAVVLTGCSSGADDDRAGDVARPAGADDVVGSWLPVSVPGYTTDGPYTRSDVALHLRADGRWRAGDGCNGLGGRYDLGEEGSFDATGSFSFQVACMNVLHEDVLTDAAVVLVDGDVLTFQDGDGAVLAEYERSA